jgi:hypothetical protein
VRGASKKQVRIREIVMRKEESPVITQFACFVGGAKLEADKTPRRDWTKLRLELWHERGD